MAAKLWKSGRVIAEKAARVEKDNLLDEAQKALDGGDLATAIQKLIDSERKEKPKKKKGKT